MHQIFIQQWFNIMPMSATMTQYYTGAGSGPVICLSCTLPCKAKRQYLLTCKVSRYCLLALHGGTALIRSVTMCVWYFFSTHICSQLFLKGVVDRGIRTIQMLALVVETSRMPYPPENTAPPPCVDPMLAHRRIRCSSIEPTQAQPLYRAGYYVTRVFRPYRRTACGNFLQTFSAL